MANSSLKDYLGDGVYVDTDGCGGIVLTTENGIETTNEIYIEPEVYKSLIRYMQRLTTLNKKPNIEE